MLYPIQTISYWAALTNTQLRRFKTFRGDSNLLINRFIKLVIETGCVTGGVLTFNPNDFPTKLTWDLPLVIGVIITLVLWSTVLVSSVIYVLPDIHTQSWP